MPGVVGVTGVEPLADNAEVKLIAETAVFGVPQSTIPSVVVFCAVPACPPNVALLDQIEGR
ncbi:MAG: hypothetical protein QM811_31905 [Pirellulales bacterium]